MGKRSSAVMEPSSTFKLRQSAPRNPQDALLRFAENFQSGFNCKTIAWETQRKYKFDVPVKRYVCKNRLGNTAKILILCARQVPDTLDPL